TPSDTTSTLATSSTSMPPALIERSRGVAVRGGGEDVLRGGDGIGGAEDRAAGDEDVDPRGRRGTGGVGIDAPVDLDLARQAPRVDLRADLRHLVERLRDERLTTPAGVDAHHQEQ